MLDAGWDEVKSCVKNLFYYYIDFVLMEMTLAS